MHYTDVFSRQQRCYQSDRHQNIPRLAPTGKYFLQASIRYTDSKYSVRRVILTILVNQANPVVNQTELFLQNYLETVAYTCRQNVYNFIGLRASSKYPSMTLAFQHHGKVRTCSCFCSLFSIEMFELSN